MFSGDTDGFDVFDEDNREDFSHLTPSSIPPTTIRRQHAASRSRNGKLTDRQLREMEVHMQEPDDNNHSSNLSHSRAQSEEDVDMDTNTEGLLLKANEIVPTFTDEFEEDLQREVAYAPGLMAATEGENVILSHQVRHQVALPPNWNYTPISQHVPNNPPAKTYPFTLDPFQKLATYSIERGESVLVSAHTSAGKTVVAEFAIATSLQNKQRVIYTSPIKALSNQKYRELVEEFKDVGLMTGDVTINPSASCLVMTTEILRGMLYHGSEVMREVAWVIFDEIHYMRDAERGVVWEETIILLPAQCHYVFLSATIPNAMEFAEWVCKNKEQPCHVVYTDFRPTPLQHYLFPSGGEGIYLVVDEKGQFREDNFNQALAAIVEGNPKNGKKAKSGPNNHNKVKGADKKDMSTDGPSDIYKIVKMIQAKNLYPVIVFSFSKRECEALALQMSNLGFNNDKEGKLVLQVFNNAISSLPESDRTLPQIKHLLPLLQRGIGIHHGGLLPILKEVIEILFQEGLVKVLFATETFSIGLNMPAKAVIFTGVQKFDGEKIRWVSGGEYIQMSGRAGRRGLDDRGVVIMMLDQKMEPAVAQGMVLGTTDPLNSAFYLSYHMVLNLMRIEGFSPEFMLERCFYQFQTAGNIPKIKQELLKLQTVVAKIQFTPVEESSLEQYHDLRVQLATCAKEIRSIIYNPQFSLQYLQSGRVVNIAFDRQPVGWGVLTGCQKARPGPGKKSADSADGNKPGVSFILDVLLAFPRDTKFEYGSGGIVTGIEESKKGKMMAQPTEFTAVKVSLDAVRYIGAPLISLPKDIRTSTGSRANAFRALQELQRRCPDGIPILDPVEDMSIRSPALQRVIRQVETLEELLYKHPMANLRAANNQARYEQFLARSEAKAKIRSLKAKLSKAVAVTQMTELKDRKRVLRRLAFTTASDVAEVKGRVACEINSADGLLLTELIFNGTFRELTVEQTVALMSCFCFHEKLDAAPAKLKEVLSVPFKMLQESARAIATVEVECNIPDVDVDAYVQKFKPDMMDVAFAWANGASFEEINTMTDAFEGSIIRMFRLLDELMRQMAAACKSLGNEELEKKFLDGIKCIKRGVVFAASLYLF
ncbi:ATP-dependent RNA helicase mtr4 [Linnemannia elongata]|nr:ATP-dependent RNA helicase mtr4 [Linnemannia elongata]